MLTTDDLLTALATDRDKGFIDRLCEKVRTEKFDLKKLIDLTFHKDQQIGFRAAWLLDVVMHANPLDYIDTLPYFAKRMEDVANESCKRHFARIMMTVTNANAPNAIQQQIANINMGPVVEKCFDWTIDPKVRVAVKVCAAETLFNLSPRYDWIKEELINQIQFLMRDGTAAIQSKGKKLLALLKSQN